MKKNSNHYQNSLSYLVNPNKKGKYFYLFVVSVNLWYKKTSILQESADCYQLESADSFRMGDRCMFLNINAP
jgi:hypothetical protein